ncbi:hypothetical protein BGT96224_A21320 [Blumeria graminis f. sp. tritici 96224]|nr:hypothetical protein BGT96224_A21320 [Blumeria graminis f. sp. tritici 96224]
MDSKEHGSTPSQKKINFSRTRFSANIEDASPMATHGNGMLGSLIQSRSNASLHSGFLRRHSSVLRCRDLTSDEENALRFGGDWADLNEFHSADERRLESVLNGPQMRSQRLIGNSNSRYQWGLTRGVLEKYWKTEAELKAMKAPIRKYYERINNLVKQYIYIDRILDSSLPHDLLNEYNNVPTYGTQRKEPAVPPMITEEEERTTQANASINPIEAPPKKIKRTPRELYKVSNEQAPLLQPQGESNSSNDLPEHEDDSVEIGDRIVQVAININLTANLFLLAGKIVTIFMTNSLSVLASLVDAILDLLSTAIIWTTTKMIERQDYHSYPIGRRRLEPLGVLVFSVIMVTSFFQVGLECIGRLQSGDHTIIQLALPSILIMSATVLIKLLCWIWCRMVKNSSVQALAQDAMTDVVFNIFSIIFPLAGFYAKIWWLDALGGLLLSLYIVINWTKTSSTHIRNLTGAAASADERNVLLYLTMRFAKTIKQIQGLQAYHCGDKINVEVDIVLDEEMTLRDSHDLGESLQYVLESVPIVDRAFVHQDYAGWNLPTHMQQQGE